MQLKYILLILAITNLPISSWSVEERGESLLRVRSPAWWWSWSYPFLSAGCHLPALQGNYTLTHQQLWTHLHDCALLYCKVPTRFHSQTIKHTRFVTPPTCGSLCEALVYAPNLLGSLSESDNNKTTVLLETEQGHCNQFQRLKAFHSFG